MEKTNQEKEVEQIILAHCDRDDDVDAEGAAANIISFLKPLLEKAKKWDELDTKIGSAYQEESEDLEDVDSEVDLGTIGEWAASAFGYL